jgi:hypothetical protein
MLRATPSRSGSRGVVDSIGYVRHQGAQEVVPLAEAFEWALHVLAEQVGRATCGRDQRDPGSRFAIWLGLNRRDAHLGGQGVEIAPPAQTLGSVDVEHLADRFPAGQ